MQAHCMHHEGRGRARTHQFWTWHRCAQSTSVGRVMKLGQHLRSGVANPQFRGVHHFLRPVSSRVRTVKICHNQSTLTKRHPPLNTEPKSGTTWLGRVVLQLALDLCGSDNNMW